MPVLVEKRQATPVSCFGLWYSERAASPLDLAWQRHCSFLVRWLGRESAAQERRKVVRRILNCKCRIEENKQDLPSVQIKQGRIQNPQALSDGERRGDVT